MNISTVDLFYVSRFFFVGYPNRKVNYRSKVSLRTGGQRNEAYVKILLAGPVCPVLGI